MALSEHEQQLLKDIESALSEDTSFATTLQRHNRRHERAFSKGASSRTTLPRTVPGWVLVVVGVVALISGIFLKVGSFPILSLVGFLMMFIGGIIVIRASDTQRGHDSVVARLGSSRASGRSRQSHSGSGRSSGSAGKDSLADQFERRFRQ